MAQICTHWDQNHIFHAKLSCLELSNHFQSLPETNNEKKVKFAVKRIELMTKTMIKKSEFLLTVREEDDGRAFIGVGGFGGDAIVKRICR